MSEQKAEKKRKRRSEPSERASKRPASDEAGAGIVKVVHIPKDGYPPVIAFAAGFAIPPKVTFDAYEKPRSKSGHSSQPELLLHSAEHARLDYAAREAQDGATEGLLKHYIGVYDPGRGELQLVEARKMSVVTTLRAEQEAIREERPSKKAGDLSLRQQLGMEFGTKKAKKAIASISENAISTQKPQNLSVEEIKKSVRDDAVASAVIDAMAGAAVGAPTREQMQAEIDSAKPRPRANLEAATPQEVYTIEELVGTEVLKQCKVKAWVEAIEAKQEVHTTSRYVARRLPKLVNDMADNDEVNDDIAKIKVLKYMLLLIDFYAALQPGKAGKGKRLPDKDVLKVKLGVDDFLLDTVKRRFASGPILTKRHVDKLLMALAALSLIVDDCATDVYHLMQDLGLTMKMITVYYREIGAKLLALPEPDRAQMGLTKQEASMHRVARLRLPLEFPKTRVVVQQMRR